MDNGDMEEINNIDQCNTQSDKSKQNVKDNISKEEHITKVDSTHQHSNTNIGAGPSKIEDVPEKSAKKAIMIDLNSVLVPQAEPLVHHSKEAQHVEGSSSYTNWVESKLSKVQAETSEKPQLNEISRITQIIKAEMSEHKKQKLVIKLPESRLDNPCEESVGDDSNQRNEQIIVCECSLNVEGDSLPTVSSLQCTDPRHEITDMNVSTNIITISKQATTIKSSSSHSKPINSEGRPMKTPSQTVKSKDNLYSEKKHYPGIRVTSLYNNKPSVEAIRSTPSSRKCNRVQPHSSNSQTHMGTNLRSENNIHIDNAIIHAKCSKGSFGNIMKPKLSDVACDSRSSLKRPSLIPKPSRPTSSPQKDNDPFKYNREIKDAGLRKLSETKIQRTSRLPSNTNIGNISNKITGLAATTTVIRSKLDITSKHKVHSKVMKEIIKTEDIEDIPSNSSDLVRCLYRIISEIKKTAKDLSATTLMVHQKQHIEKLLTKISDIQKIADKLNETDSVSYKDKCKAGTRAKTTEDSPKEKRVTLNESKDKKVCLKLIHSKEKQEEKEAMQSKCTEQTAEVATVPCASKQEPPKSEINTVEPVKQDNKEDLQSSFTEQTADVATMDSALRQESPKSETKAAEPQPNNKNLKPSDSLDGVFIPSFEPPIINMDEEEESNGLDITITFPEFKQFLKNESELSVRLSDISSEALKKLKRCPKDFTLRMDFVQGKVLLQTGKRNNNLRVEPELRSIDYKKSDVISLKPSTECCFASQLIPVETFQDGNSSHKSLKSTDSELFDIVKLPHIYRNPSLNAVTRSCITFKNDKILSMALMARHLHRSLPQISSLTNIYEDRFIENFKSVFQIQEKKRKNRNSVKRGLTSNNSN